MAVLTTTPTEVANNLSITVGCRLLAWYSDATNSGATVHLKLQAISQGINYTGTNKNYDLQLGSSSVTDVAWSYAPLNYNTWYDVYEMTQWVDSGATVYAQGKIWTYVYGAAYTSANLTMPTFGTAPTGLSLSDIVRHADGFSGTVSITGWGGVGDANSRYRELQVWTHSSSGLTPPRRWQIARGNNLSGVITVNNSSSTSDFSLSEKLKHVPTFALRAGLHIISQTSFCLCFNKRYSIDPPVFSLLPYNLAGKTLESFKIKQSPSSNISHKS